MASKDIGMMESALLLIIGLLGWVLIWLNSMDKIYVGINSRVVLLEQQNEKGDRFTYQDGQIMKKDVEHNRIMIMDHMERVEPKIEKMYEYVVKEQARIDSHEHRQP